MGARSEPQGVTGPPLLYPDGNVPLKVVFHTALAFSSLGINDSARALPGISTAPSYPRSGRLRDARFPVSVFCIISARSSRDHRRAMMSQTRPRSQAPLVYLEAISAHLLIDSSRRSGKYTPRVNKTTQGFSRHAHLAIRRRMRLSGKACAMFEYKKEKPRQNANATNLKEYSATSSAKSRAPR